MADILRGSIQAGWRPTHAAGWASRSCRSLSRMCHDRAANGVAAGWVSACRQARSHSCTATCDAASSAGCNALM